MGIVAIKIKIMPSSIETDLERLREDVTKLIENNEGKNIKIDEEPLAFGLKSLIAFFALDEKNELESIENALVEIDGVSSTQVIDMRRAFG